ncbi:hypothetical protein ABIA85_000138 [Bradyrhizobium sp. LA6.10]
MPACPAWPSMVMLTRPPEAITTPSWTAMVPAASPGQLWKPNTRVIGKRSNRPAPTIARAPPSPSSAGWKMKSTVPLQLVSATSSAAAPSSEAVCPS